MARPREFDDSVVLDAAVERFWNRGYEATSVRDLIEATGLTGASLYNAFGDKRALFRAALAHYAETSIGKRIQRCEALPPRQAIAAVFDEILRRSLNVLMGVRVLARARPDRALLEGAITPALALLDGTGSQPGTRR